MIWGSCSWERQDMGRVRLQTPSSGVKRFTLIGLLHLWQQGARGPPESVTDKLLRLSILQVCFTQTKVSESWWQRSQVASDGSLLVLMCSCWFWGSVPSQDKIKNVWKPSRKSSKMQNDTRLSCSPTEISVRKDVMLSSNAIKIWKGSWRSPVRRTTSLTTESRMSLRLTACCRRSTTWSRTTEEAATATTWSNRLSPSLQKSGSSLRWPQQLILHRQQQSTWRPGSVRV